jgi:hypothetical protein
MNITPLYAGLIGLLLLLLSTRIIIFRRAAGINLGHGENAILERRIRAQANLGEYAPLALVLLALLELSNWPAPTLHALGILLVAGRMLHGWALSFTSSNSVARISGIALTLTMIGFAALYCLARFDLGGLG